MQSSSSTAPAVFPIVINPELPARPPKDVITPAQEAFWNYIVTFNRLPENPTEVQKAVFATRGEATHFKFISTSTKSVFSNVEGMKAHRKLFAERYPWVKKILEEEQITLEVDEFIYQGSPEEILKKHEAKYGWTRENYYQPTGKRGLFVKRWLESLSIVDYIFACGSQQDRIDGLVLLAQTVNPAAYPSDTATVRLTHGKDLEIPASFDIVIPLANQFQEHVTEVLVRSLHGLIEGSGDAASFIEYLKWTQRVKAFHKWENFMSLNEVQLGNHCVRNGMHHYPIYWYHLQKNVRPHAGSSAIAIKALFNVLYGEQNGTREHKKYLSLLNAAYPPRSEK